jgi:HEAT repeat protein
MPHTPAPSVTDRERRAAEKRGAVFDNVSADWRYGGRSIPDWLAAIVPDGKLRPEAARVADERVGPEAYAHVPALVSALDDKRTYTFACVALGRIGQRAAGAVAALIQRMRAGPKFGVDSPARSKEDVDRSFAADAVAKIGISVDLLGELVEALRDPYFVVGRNAAMALGKLGAAAAPAVPALIEALDDPQLTQYAAQALGNIGAAARAAGPALIASTASVTSHECRAAVAEAIGRIGYAEGETFIHGLLQDRYANVRKAAIKALERLAV